MAPSRIREITAQRAGGLEMLLAYGTNTGMTIVEAPTRDQSISAQPRPVAAFIGRCLSGPCNQPVRIESVSAFERTFGGRWQASSLGEQLAQFFLHGGREAIVVRVANNADGGILVLPTAGGSLRLRAVNPGSGERLRASVDYDGVDATPALFNLTIQRLDIHARLITDQEIYPGASMIATHERYVGSLLEDSALLRLADSDHDTHRPAATVSRGASATVDYLPMTQFGLDGDPLSGYDLVGSDRHGTGLFALQDAPHFDFLYACGGRGLSETSAAFVFAAEQYCQQRNAMLLIDPPADCASVDDVVAWRSDVAFDSPSIISYFPPVLHRQETTHVHSIAGALMGILARQDEHHHVWAALADNVRQNSAALHRDWKAAYTVEADDALRLLRAGVNPILAGSQRRLLFPGLVTAANRRDRRLGSLARQRLVKFILRHIERGTRWAVFEQCDTDLWQRIEQQVGLFLAELADAGAFASDDGKPAWSVRCDAGTNGHHDGQRDGIRLLIAFRPVDTTQPLMFSIRQRADGTSVCRTAFEYPAL